MPIGSIAFSRSQLALASKQQMRLPLRQPEHELAEQRVGPRKPGPCEVTHIVQVEAFMQEAGARRGH